MSTKETMPLIEYKFSLQKKKESVSVRAIASSSKQTLIQKFMTILPLSKKICLITLFLKLHQRLNRRMI